MGILEQAKLAKQASYQMMTLDTHTKNNALFQMADALICHMDQILVENMKDLEAASNQGRPQAFLDRLTLTKERILGMASGLRKVAALPDPIGTADMVIQRPNGLRIEKRRVPLGVVGIIFEARPNVTADSIALCLKSGNAMLLRGGSDAIHSNLIISDLLSKAAYDAGIPEGAI